MKTLYQSLIDYDMALLQAIAACRRVALTTPSKHEAVEILTAALLSPSETAITLTDLSPDEQAALEFLLEHGGQVEGPRFTRHYGAIRSMGAARLKRERPWQDPANPAEGLWYRGLIYKGFQITPQGGGEVVYIPDDVLPLLRIANSKYPKGTLSQITKSQIAEAQIAETPAGVGQATLKVAQAPTPAVVLSGEGRLRENVFNLLVYLHTSSVLLRDKTELAAKDRDALTACLLPVLQPDYTLAVELDFLLHLGQRAGLLVMAHGRLRPDREPARTWLQESAPEQTQFLQNTWRADPTWNDLWHVPGLAPQPTGWENSPLLARSKILGYLAPLTAGPDTWYGLDDFVAAIKRVDPDFQRPGGDYESWYLQDTEGRSLMGFAHWDQVEGALIRHLVTHLLPTLGVVDLGLPTETSGPTCFRITSAGGSFLAGQAATAPTPQKPPFLRVDDNFYARVPGQLNLYDRFQLARFARLERREQDRVVYRITQAGVGRALRNGVAADQMVAFLARVTNNRTPLKVVETLRTWGRRQGTAHIEPATLLRLKHESLVEELRQNPDLRPLLGEVIGPKTILIPSENVSEVRRLLMELGYLT